MLEAFYWLEIQDWYCPVLIAGQSLSHLPNQEII